jgi:hypothetical protein
MLRQPDLPIEAVFPADDRCTLACCPTGHHVLALGSSLHPSPAAASVAYVEWHCDMPNCYSGSARTPSIGRFHCADCQFDLCQTCHTLELRRQRGPDPMSHNAVQSLQVDVPLKDPRPLALHSNPSTVSYTIPSRPNANPRRDTSQRRRPASAGRSVHVSSAWSALPAPASNRQIPPPMQPTVPQRPKRNRSARRPHGHSTRSLSTRRIGGPPVASEDDRQRHRQLEQYFQSKFSKEEQIATSSGLKDPKIDRPAVSCTSFASASTVPTTPEAVSQMNSKAQERFLPQVPVTSPSKRSASEGDHEHLPSIEMRWSASLTPRRLEAPSLREPDCRMPDQPKECSSSSTLTHRVTDSKDPKDFPLQGAQVQRLSALHAKLKLDSLLSPKLPVASPDSPAIRRTPPAPVAFAAPAAVSIGGGSFGAGSSMRALLGELDARRHREGAR